MLSAAAAVLAAASSAMLEGGGGSATILLSEAAAAPGWWRRQLRHGWRSSAIEIVICVNYCSNCFTVVTSVTSSGYIDGVYLRGFLTIRSFDMSHQMIFWEAFGGVIDFLGSADEKEAEP